MPSQDCNSECSLRFAALFSTQGEPFICFFRYRARLPRPHPGRACPVACSRARATDVSAEVCSSAKRRDVCPLITAVSKYGRKSYHLLSGGGEKYGLAEWRNGRWRARLLLHAQREGPPRAREEGVLDAGRFILASKKLQAFFVRGNHDQMTRHVDFFS